MKVLVTCGLVAATLVSPALAQPVFNYIDRIGLYDAPDSSGNHHNIIRVSAPTGYFAGEGGGGWGWVAGPTGTTTRIGLMEDDGDSYVNEVHLINRNGQVAGLTHRYGDSRVDYSQTGWVANSDGTTRSIGIIPTYLNNAGVVVGTWYRFTGPTEAALVDAAGTLHPLGTFGGFSSVAGLNEAGYVIGKSFSYTMRYDAWLRSPSGEYTVLGLFGPEYEHPEGDQNFARHLNDAGWISGTTALMVGANETQVTWRRTPEGVTSRIGMYADNYLRTSPSAMNASGEVLGVSINLENAQDTRWWLATPEGITRSIGLFDAAHTYGGRVYSRVHALTNSGYMYGNANRFTPAGGGLGQDAFLAHRSGSTRVLSLTDSKHTAPGGYRFSEASGINDSPVVWGYNRRYFGGWTQRGQTAWFYDSQTRTMRSLELSVRPSDGYAFSKIIKVLKNGTVLGTYTRFVGNTDTGERAFAWIPGRGVVKIDVNLDVDVKAQGWNYFESAEFASAAGHIAGTGSLAGGDGSSFGVFLVRRNPAAP